ncbi:hypothetical protein OAF74_01225 [bacterium]|jgi:hypothetical protein|nr:hypothetical protein [bacterium]MDB4731436.1 hypothetical protein [bacterium]
MTDPSKKRSYSFRYSLLLLKFFCGGFFTISLLVLGYAICLSNYYSESTIEALKPSAKALAKLFIAKGTTVYDPSVVIEAKTGPDSKPESNYIFIDEELLNQDLIPASSDELFLTEISNQKIVKASQDFSYQTYEEPRLHELRKKYKLKEVVADAANEFEALVLLRNWSRSQFHRENYQPFETNFDALRVLDRNLKIFGKPYDIDKHFDPCHFFPLLYSQVVISMGYTSRLVAAEHGMTEVWSNDFQKWVLMDAELNYHVVREGVPLSLTEIAYATPDEIELVRGTQSSDANPFQVHLKIDVISPEGLINMIRGNLLDIVDLRNDWMTNHYFRGHPSRSDQNSLTLITPFNETSLILDRHLRPTTIDKEKFRWTLNQAEIYFKHNHQNEVKLSIRTVTPNFKHFKITHNGIDDYQKSSEFVIKLREGSNSIKVQPVNLFDVPGISSQMNFNYLPGT